MGRSELLRSMMGRILSVAWCCACATADPLLDLAIPLDDACEAGSKDCDLSLLQLRGQLKIADEQEENESGPGKKEQKEAKNKMKEERKDKMEKKEKKKLRKEEKQGKGKGGQEDRGSDNSGSANGAFLFETSPADDKKAVEKKKKTQEKNTKKV